MQYLGPTPAMAWYKGGGYPTRTQTGAAACLSKPARLSPHRRLRTSCSDMTDIVDQATRSRMMRAIRGRDTAPELAVRRYLHATGLRFRISDRRLPGRPDLVFPSLKTALFVHGCFWHQHPGCPHASTPSSSTDFWRKKLEGNIERDSRNEKVLREMGWEVLTIWECETRDPLALDRLFWMVIAPKTSKQDGRQGLPS